MTDTVPFNPLTELTDQATSPIVVSLAVEGLGGIDDYSVRVQVPGYEEYVRVVANIISQVNEMVFTLNWPQGDIK
jgi:hypothetical protein